MDQPSLPIATSVVDTTDTQPSLIRPLPVPPDKKHVYFTSTATTATSSTSPALPVAASAAGSSDCSISIESINRSHRNLEPIDAIFLSSQKWDIKPSCKEELLITNPCEFVIIAEFRKTISIQTADISHKFVDSLIAKQAAIFESRNENKIPNKPKKKSFFSRSKK